MHQVLKALKKLGNHLNAWLKIWPKAQLIVLALIAGAALTFVLQNFEMNLIEAYLYDFRVRHTLTPTAPSDQVVLVKIDDTSLEKLGELSPLSIKSQLALLKHVGGLQPKAIAYFVNFNDAVQIDPTTGNPDITTLRHANDFVQIADQIQANGTPVILGTEVDVTGEVVPPFPLSKLPHRIATIHKDGTTFSEDKVTRRALFSIYDEPVMHVKLAEILTGKSLKSEYRGVYTMPEIDAQYFYINFAAPTEDDENGVQSHFPEISAIDILEGKISHDALTALIKDKIVLIGSKTKEDSNDYVYTPFSKKIFSNAKLTVHGHIIETLMHNSAILRTSKSADTILTFILTSLIIGIVFNTSPAFGVLISTLGGFLLIGLSMLAFQFAGLWIGLAHPLLGTFFAYYLFVPYRLIMEYKKRWQFQKKNEVLVQVEELKSNFMSLITHDLKTPVARIQGMAEILERAGADPTIISEIFSSTDELNRFITSILELAKIESNHIELDKQSKDINKVIEDVIHKFEFQARTKKITIKTSLEPLFPIRLDVSLITKVISNLIDNAIKYSPEGAQITIASKESENRQDFVEIIVSDTGYGLSAKDAENLFSKFYRAKNDVTMRIKGTGLGLYLSRYFVELHNGSLTVRSEETRGTEFTILLPSVDEKDYKKSANPSSKSKGEIAYV